MIEKVIAEVMKSGWEHDGDEREKRVLVEGFSPDREAEREKKKSEKKTAPWCNRKERRCTQIKMYRRMYQSIMENFIYCRYVFYLPNVIYAAGSLHMWVGVFIGQQF